MPVVAIAGALALSAGLFFAFTLPNCSGKKKGDEVGDAPAVPPVEPLVPQPDPDPQPEVTPEPEPGPEPKPELKAERFATARQLVAAVAGRLAAGEVDRLNELISDDVLSQPRALGFMHAFGAGGHVLHPTEPFAEIGDVDELNRWALYLVPRGTAEADLTAARQRITVDVAQSPKVGWAVAGVHVPESLRSAALAAGVKLPNGSTWVGGEDLDRADPLFVADDFVTSLLSQDYAKALSLCGDRVPDEKIAGLCMVFEEGEFQMLKEKPLTTTSLGAAKNAAWVFARVRSEKLDTDGEFGVELKVDDEKGWQVDNVNIASMLDSFIKGSEAGRVPYTPIKTNPDGGDTLVLYFEYDKAELLPRSLRQIDILARILKADERKTLNIGGHADAMGTDEYNRKLSEGRAIAVREALVKFGVPESQILTTAWGEAKPWKRNTTEDGTDNPEGRQHNRRAEIYLNF